MVEIGLVELIIFGVINGLSASIGQTISKVYLEERIKKSKKELNQRLDLLDKTLNLKRNVEAKNKV